MERDLTSGDRPGDGPDVHVVDAGDFGAAAADWIGALLAARATTSDGPVSLALSGGTTPGPAYERLAALDGVDWSRVEIFFADERAVPPDDERSNYGLVRRLLVDRLSRPPRAVHRMEGEAEDLEEEAGRYANELPERLDVLVLGIGEDGHTASLFPGSASVEERDRRVLPVEGPKPPARRLTLTAPVIRAARAVVVLARGGRKAEAVSRALEGPFDPSACPVQLARGAAWILDREAAGMLGS